jgi:hypothetical protein
MSQMRQTDRIQAGRQRPKGWCKVSDKSESVSVAAWMDDRRSHLDLANWAFYMLGLSRCVAFTILLVTRDQDPKLHKHAWAIFDAWLEWQQDVAVSSEGSTDGR